jgi:DNA-binding beta-propeller fold protein YncE
MKFAVVALLLQALAAPDPAQMEKVPDLGYTDVPHGLQLPAGVTMGAPSSVATTSKGHIIVLNRGRFPLLEFDAHGAFVRSLGEGQVVRPHGMRVDADDNIWMTDVSGHTVTKISPSGEVLLTLGVKGHPGDWNEAANSRLFNEPTDVAIGPRGDIFVVQGHYEPNPDPRVLRFDKQGRFITSWGGKGKGPGQFIDAHSIVVDQKGQVYVADRLNRRIQIFDVDGRYIKEWTYLGLPCGLYLDRAGTMYLVTGWAGQLLELDANGKAVAATGEPGKGPGKFGEAHYLTVGPAGEIYVADPSNSFLHQFVRK